MPIYNLFNEIWSYFENIRNFTSNNIIDFLADKNSILLKYKEKIVEQTGNNGTKHFKIMVSLKYLSIFCRTLEIPSINYVYGSYCDHN